MITHPPIRPSALGAGDSVRMARLERDLAEATLLLRRLLEAEDRIGLVYPVMDDARAFLVRRRPSPP